MRRFTVALEATDYERLKAIAERHRPRLKLGYVVQYAVRQFLDRAQEGAVAEGLGNPLVGVPPHAK